MCGLAREFRVRRTRLLADSSAEGRLPRTRAHLSLEGTGAALGSDPEGSHH